MTQPDLIAGRYRVERALGRGGMGTVWLCHDEQLDRQVAIKQIDSTSNIDGQAIERARREARTIASIHNPNVVAIHDILEDAGQLWLVMEYVPAHNLQEIISERGARPEAEVAHMGVQIASALVDAHERGIIHRDVKPANVLVRDDGVAKLVDFGIARSGSDDQLTMQGILSGTPVYFSPELARTGDPDYPSDVWALGATMYAAVEGRAPYESAPTPVAMLHRIVSEEPRPMQRADLLRPIIDGMMTRDPQQRWSLQRVIGELRRIDHTGGATAMMAGSTLAVDDDDDRTQVLGAPLAAGAAAADDRTQVMPRTDELPLARSVSGPTRVRPVPPASRPPVRPAAPARSSGSSAGWIVASLLFVVLAVGAAVWWVLQGSDPGTRDPATPTTVEQTEQPQQQTQTTTPAPTVETTPPTTTEQTTQPTTATTTAPTTTEAPTNTGPPETNPGNGNPGNGNPGNGNPGNGNEGNGNQGG